MTANLVPANVDQTQVLAALGLNVRDPNAQAALLVCDRYNLDPLLKHVQLIKQAIYITRDGYLHVAHRSGVFDGMEIVDEGESDKFYWAKVAVYRKDMSRPFTCKARCRKDERTFGDPWDMAISRAERRALKRAFNVAGVPADEGDYDEHAELYNRQTGAANVEPERPATEARTVEDPPLADTMLEVKATEKPQPLASEVDEGKITTKQNRMLHALLNGLGVKDDDARHKTLSVILDRPINSASDLTVEEASRAIEALKEPDAASA